MTILNAAYNPKCDSKLISFGQLKKTRISYHNLSKSMILKKVDNIIGIVQQRKIFLS